jgi:hypothetical protein
LEKRYAVLLTADNPMWCWLTRYAGWATSVYRVRADGVTSYKPAFGVNFTGEILPFGEIALFEVPESHTRQVSSTMTRNKGDSAFAKGISGLASTRRATITSSSRLEGGTERERVADWNPIRRSNARLLKGIKAVPWEARSARPLDEHAQILVKTPLVAPTAREAEAKEAKGQEKTEPTETATEVTTDFVEPTGASATTTSGADVATSHGEADPSQGALPGLSSVDEDMTAGTGGTEARLARVVAAVSLDDPDRLQHFGRDGCRRVEEVE